MQDRSSSLREERSLPEKDKGRNKNPQPSQLVMTGTFSVTQMVTHGGREIGFGGKKKNRRRTLKKLNEG